MSEKNATLSENGREKKPGKKKTGLLAAAVIVLLAVILGCVLYFNSDGYRISRQMDLGQRYLVECDYEQAIVAFQEVIDIDPMSVDAYLGLAEAYEGMGDYVMAIKTLAQGHEITGDERLQAKKDEVENLKAEAEEPEQVTEPETARETDKENQEQDAVLEEAYAACVVDGIYHHGYTLHDLSDEERMLLDDLITYTEGARYRECAELLSDDRYVEIAVKHCDYETDGDGTDAGSWIAYNGYKIHIDYAGHWDARSVYLIPIEDNLGVIYDYRKNDMTIDGVKYDTEVLSYVYCECTDGMYNGVFYSSRYTRTLEANYESERIQEGEVRNGIIEGEVVQKEFRTKLNGQKWELGPQYATFVDGKPQNVQYETQENGYIKMIYMSTRSVGDGKTFISGKSMEELEARRAYLDHFGIALSLPYDLEDGSLFIYGY